MQYKIVRKVCDLLGSEGYILESRQYLDGYIVDTEGTLIAHDLVEHPVTPHKNLAVDEFLALGAICYFRDYCWQVQELSTNIRYNIAENVASDVYGLLEYICMEDLYIPEPPVKYSRNSIVKEAVHRGFKNALTSEYFDYDKSILSRQLKQRLEGWLATGEQRFKDRFKHADIYDVGQAFIQIAKCIEFANRMNFYDSILTVNYSKGTADIKPIEEYDGW